MWLLDAAVGLQSVVETLVAITAHNLVVFILYLFCCYVCIFGSAVLTLMLFRAIKEDPPLSVLWLAYRESAYVDHVAIYELRNILAGRLRSQSWDVVIRIIAFIVILYAFLFPPLAIIDTWLIAMPYHVFTVVSAIIFSHYILYQIQGFLSEKDIRMIDYLYLTSGAIGLLGYLAPLPGELRLTSWALLSVAIGIRFAKVSAELLQWYRQPGFSALEEMLDIHLPKQSLVRRTRGRVALGKPLKSAA